MKLRLSLLAAAALLAACASAPSNFSYSRPAAARGRLGLHRKAGLGHAASSR